MKLEESANGLPLQEKGTYIHTPSAIPSSRLSVLRRFNSSC